MKIIGFIILSIVLFVSLFKIAGSELTNNVTAIALMVLLLSLFSDLKEFNFWGLRGVKNDKEKEIVELEGKKGIDQKNAPKPKKSVLRQARQETSVMSLMDTDKGNFLELAFEIERLLRIAAVALGERVDANAHPREVIQLLHKKGLLTEDGMRQVENVRWLRNMIVHGRFDEVSASTLDAGTTLAQNLYEELRDWLEQSAT